MNKIIKCEKCGQIKLHYANGLCINCYQKEWAKRNPKKRKAYFRKWYLKNKEKDNERTKNWCKNNPDRIKEIRTRAREKWKRNNPDKDKESKKKWQQNNPDKIREYNFKRWAKGHIEKGIISKLINENIFKYGIITCEACGKSCEDDYEIDHIIPISKGGTNDYDNLQILCTKCNREKYTDIANYRQKKSDNQLFLKGNS